MKYSFTVMHTRNFCTKAVPGDRADIECLANAFQVRKEKERERQQRTETQKLEAILEAGESEAAIQAALNIIRKKRPELLK